MRVKPTAWRAGGVVIDSPRPPHYKAVIRAHPLTLQLPFWFILRKQSLPSPGGIKRLLLPSS